MITKVPKSTQDEMNSAVQAAKNAYKTWSQTSVLTRQQTMFKLQNLIQQNNVMMIFIFQLFNNLFSFIEESIGR